jgi:(2Fe-2S) ferredoxin
LAALVRSAPYLNGFYDVARQWPDAIRRRVDAATERATARRRAVRTPHDARAYQADVRERFWRSMGGPLRPAQRASAFETAGELEHLGVRVTRLVYESHPGVPVSALLYRPPGDGGRRPAVLFLSGHHETAKHHPEYQRVCLDLALHGLVVLAIDPWGQGERFQYAVPGAEQPQVATGTFEHSYCGLQCFLTGGAVARYFAWDGVRALDVLAGLPEVDAARIGVTGNSGGGTQTMLLLLADERPAAAMPCTYIHGLSAFVRAGLPHDAEQNFVGSLAGAIDHADLLACVAPRPLLVGAVRSDFFPLEATEASVESARGVYAALGAGERIALTVDEDRHWYTDVLRERAVRFFTATLDGAARYERRDLPTLPEARLWCSPSGQLYRDRPGLRTVFDLNREFLAARRRPPPATADEARARLLSALDWPSPPEALPLHPRYFPPAAGPGGAGVQRFFFFSEPDLAVAGAMLRPPAPAGAPPGPGGAPGDRAPGDRAPGGGARTWLLLLPDGTASAPHLLAEAAALVAGGDRVCLFDVRGRGAVQSHPTQGRPVDSWLGFEAYNAYLAMLFDGSTVSERVFDVARAIEFLARHEATPGGLALRAHGPAALWGYLAAALDPRVLTVHLTARLPSWGAVVDTRLYDPQTITAALVVPGVLQHFDLPDLVPLFSGRELRLDDPLPVAARPEQLPLRP